MPFTPELSPEIRRRMVARFIGRSKLRDLAEGDDFGTFLGIMGDELASHQQKLKEYIDGYFFHARGEVLDERAGQLPGDFDKRRKAKAARGGGVTLIRSDASTSNTYPPNSIILSRSGAPSVTYTNRSTVSFSSSSYESTDNVFVCTTTGAVGNAMAGSVNTVNAAPGTIYNVSAPLEFTGGFDREEDDDLSTRMRLWVMSLTRTTPDGIRGIAMNFVSSEGESLRFPPIVWEDPDNRGYCELLINNGFGFTGYTRDAYETTGTFPTLTGTARFQLPFDFPAHTPPVFYIEGSPSYSPHPDFISIEERGVLITRESPALLDVSGGRSWAIKGHKVLFGFPAELQAHLEEKCRAAGNRIRVRLPEVTRVTLSANVTKDESDVTIPILFDRIRKGIVSYMMKLPPGEPLIFFRLCADLATIPGVRDIKFDNTGNIVPLSPRNKLITYYSDISLR